MAWLFSQAGPVSAGTRSDWNRRPDNVQSRKSRPWVAFLLSPVHEGDQRMRANHRDGLLRAIGRSTRPPTSRHASRRRMSGFAPAPASSSAASPQRAVPPTSLVPAARRCLAQRGIAPAAVDCVIVATMTPDRLCPSTAAVVQRKLGAVNAWGFDLAAACSGFVYGLVVATKMVESGVVRSGAPCAAPTG